MQVLAVLVLVALSRGASGSLVGSDSKKDHLIIVDPMTTAYKTATVDPIDDINRLTKKLPESGDPVTASSDWVLRSGFKPDGLKPAASQPTYESSIDLQDQGALAKLLSDQLLYANLMPGHRRYDDPTASSSQNYRRQFNTKTGLVQKTPVQLDNIGNIQELRGSSNRRQFNDDSDWSGEVAGQNRKANPNRRNRMRSIDSGARVGFGESQKRVSRPTVSANKRRAAPESNKDDDEEVDDDDEADDGPASRRSGDELGDSADFDDIVDRPSGRKQTRRQMAANGRSQGQAYEGNTVRGQSDFDPDLDDTSPSVDASESSKSDDSEENDEDINSTNVAPIRLVNESELESMPQAEVQIGEASGQQVDLQTAAGHHHGHSHGHYYQFVEVPKKKTWKFGFKRGNHKHEIERHEKGHKNKFYSSFKWHAKEKCKKKKKCKSVGKMTWEYKHHDKKHHG